VAWPAMACSDAHLLHRGGVVGGDRALSWCLLLLCGTSKVKTLTSQVRRWRRLRRRAPRWKHCYWKLRSQLYLWKNQLHKFGLRLCEMLRIHVCSRSWINTHGGGGSVAALRSEALKEARLCRVKCRCLSKEGQDLRLCLRGVCGGIGAAVGGVADARRWMGAHDRVGGWRATVTWWRSCGSRSGL
jgi:hypothetical protein